MAYNIVLSNNAINDINDIFSWYEQQKTGLGTDFMVEVYDYLDLIAQSPRLFPIDFKYYRKAVLKRFSKYVIFYTIESSDVIYVVAVFNTRQNPSRKFRL